MDVSSTGKDAKNSPRERPATELLDEHLAAILNSLDVGALSRVLFVPVLLLFDWKKNKT